MSKMIKNFLQIKMILEKITLTEDQIIEGEKYMDAFVPNWRLTKMVSGTSTIDFTNVDYQKAVKNPLLKNEIKNVRFYFGKAFGLSPGCMCYTGINWVLNIIKYKLDTNIRKEENDGNNSDQEIPGDSL